MPVLYPVFLDLSDRTVLVVGGGRVAARKLRGLAPSGARITVVANDLCRDIRDAAEEAGAEILQRSYQDGDLAGRWLVIAATDDAGLNRAISEEASRRGVFCNVVDCPDLCSFHVPASVRRGLLQIAVSTSGASPALAGRIRRQLEEDYGEAYGLLLDAMRELRDYVRERHPDSQPRRREFLESFLDSDAPRLLLVQGDRQAFQDMVDAWKSR
jgi:precorrin-2 dehydrogenase/sirohydrochlorin ferrochelatase